MDQLNLAKDLFWSALVFQAGILLYSVFIHRSIAHGAFTFRRPVAVALWFIAPLVTGIRIRRWTGVHRLHHMRPDDPAFDAHSPTLHGRAMVLLATPILYKRFVRKNMDMVDRVVPELPNRRIDRVLGSAWTSTAFHVAIALVLLPWRDAFFVVAVESLARWIVVGALNSLHPTQGKIINVRALGLLAMGEGMHRNHHAKPERWFFSRGPFDPAALVIQVGLMVSLIKLPSSAPEWTRVRAV